MFSNILKLSSSYSAIVISSSHAPRFVAGTMLEAREAEITGFHTKNAADTADSCVEQGQIVDSCSGLVHSEDNKEVGLPFITWRLTANQGGHRVRLVPYILLSMFVTLRNISKIGKCAD